MLSWRYRDPGLLLGEQIGASRRSRRCTAASAATCRSRWSTRRAWTSSAGRPTSCCIGGAETWRTRTRLRAEDKKPDWTQQDESVPQAPGGEDDVPMAGPAEMRIKLVAPAHVYPMFEQALRIAAGESSDEHRRRIGELWSQFSAVAEGNPDAWSRQRLTAEEIWQPGPTNRMISWPYTKLMNSNNMVDQARGHPSRVRRRRRPGCSIPVGAVGVPVRGHGFARHLRARRAVRVRTVPRRSGSPGAGRWNWPAAVSTTSISSTSTPAFRRLSRSPRPSWGFRWPTRSGRSPSPAG